MRDAHRYLNSPRRRQSSNEVEKPLFKLSSAYYFAWGYSILILSIGLLISAIVAGADPAAIVIVLPLTLGGLLIIFRIYTLKGRSGNFYESSFVITGWKFNREFSYSQLKYVTRISGFVGGVLMTLIFDDATDVVIYRNPRGCKWDTEDYDLYTWLNEKIGCNNK